MATDQIDDKATRASPIQCVVCLESFSQESASLVHLRCCKGSISHGTSGLCRSCLKAVLAHSSFPGYGRCPLCRTFFKMTASSNVGGGEDNRESTVEPLIGMEPCACCRQVRVILNDECCDACCLGRRYRLRYSCDRCHAMQVIPHPMWRYQASPDAFTTDTWACQRCAAFTHWRLIAEDLRRVPHDDIPLAWGQDRTWLGRMQAAQLGDPEGTLGQLVLWYGTLFVLLFCLLQSVVEWHSPS